MAMFSWFGVSVGSMRDFGNEVPGPWQQVGATRNRAHPLDARQPHGRRHLVVTVVQEVDSSCYLLIVSGNKWEYRTLLDRT